MKRILITLYVLASVVLTAVAQARFTSNTEMYSFGQIEWKHPVTVQYTITNTGDRPLVLTSRAGLCLLRSPVDKNAYCSGGKRNGECDF